MPIRLNPYLSFAGDARQAMERYREIFGGELSTYSFAEMGAEGPDADRLMHANLTTDDGLVLMGADVPPGTEAPPRGDDLSVSLSGSAAEDGERLRRWWEALADGGTVTMPLEVQSWGDEFGMCRDRFGIPWMVNIGHPEG